MLINGRLTNLLNAFATILTDKTQGLSKNELLLGDNVMPALVTIYHYPYQSVDFLSRALSLSHSGTVRLVNKIVEKEMIAKQKGEDHRNIQLVVTTKGEEQIQQFFEKREVLFKHGIDMLNDEEKKWLESILEKILSTQANHLEQTRVICRLCNADACLHNNDCPVSKPLK
ncbi:MarR family winged helix-turn-helix transcriptional regulator [Pseudalkalibacillus salsuginis]|uniref:MarR family winged helix-turn-helix transcriptional regulator n=1 Tax=Pseudalkalibacillus salsuginis TaxID=2910972 RepID=UPI001F3B6B87|nr:hypothetical protein [Pseudalkalibacillus salsuginis]MCF6411507.1 hypothetical protein [Pseudalkalibacillus salsuginis]